MLLISAFEETRDFVDKIENLTVDELSVRAILTPNNMQALKIKENHPETELKSHKRHMQWNSNDCRGIT